MYHRVNGFANVSVFATSTNDVGFIFGTAEEDSISLHQDQGTYKGAGVTRSFQGFSKMDIYLDASRDTFAEEDVWFDFDLHDEPDA